MIVAQFALKEEWFENDFNSCKEIPMGRQGLCTK